MIERDRSVDRLSRAFDYVQFHGAGDAAAGEYRCAECGYGVTVRKTLPRCPMCTGASWERGGWSRSRRSG